MKTEKTTRNTIVQSHIKSLDTEEVDHAMYNDVLGKELCDEAYEDWGPHVIYMDKVSLYTNTPMKIDVAIEILNKFKELGANYVSVDFNSDHPDYEFSGFNVHQATEEDIKRNEDEEKQHSNEQANALRLQAEKLIEEAKKLEQ